MMLYPKPKTYCRCGCGTEISATKKWVSGHNFRTKQKNVFVKNNRTYKYINCDRCKKTFPRRTDQIGRHNDKNYCSRRCANKENGKKPRSYPERKTGEYRNCLQCKERFYAIRYRIINENPKYCSKKCEVERQRERGIVPANLIKSINNKGKNNGMYKNGKYVRNGRPSKVKLRNQVIERDGGNWCLFCGKPGPGLHLHRIIYGSQGGKYELDNCVQLCAKHHGEVHSSKKNWMPILKDHIENGTLKKGVRDL